MQVKLVVYFKEFLEQKLIFKIVKLINKKFLYSNRYVEFLEFQIFYTFFYGKLVITKNKTRKSYKLEFGNIS